jgi:Holliday junction resolvasome RuvABC ATP-dependent DNA helicase subunit
LFFDEAHNLPDKLLEIFLTLLEKDNERIVREVTINHRDVGPILYQLDIRNMHIAFGTTDHNAMPEALLDRLTEICLERYSDEQLLAIFLDRVKVEVDEQVKPEIVKCFRGHPRDAVAKADDLMKCIAASGKEKVDIKVW